MASVDFPYDLCTITLSGYGLDEDENVRRTPFDSGLVAQKRIASQVMKSRTFEIFVKQSNIAAWRQWLDTNGADFFNFRDWQETDFSTDPPTAVAMRDCRIRGGRVPLSYVDDQLLDGERYFSGRMTVEGFIA